MNFRRKEEVGDTGVQRDVDNVGCAGNPQGTGNISSNN